MGSVFTSIIEGALPAHFVWKDSECVAFLTINPITDGHTLVVPRVEQDHWLDLEPTLVAHLMKVAHAVGGAINAIWQPARVGLMIAGFEVPHTHMHVMAINDMGDMSFANAASSVDHDSLAKFASAIGTRLKTMP